jgi:hypothetical protein
LAVAFLLASGHSALAADEATLLRVFLADGTSLVSYGEPARVGERVVFSMPTAATPDPPLRLIDIAASRVDWDRTNQYAAAARQAHYVATQAELDYAALSNRVADALNDVAQSGDAARRLTVAENARRLLAAWPGEHYGYRQNDVRQMLALLDEAIADLRAATGQGRFDLSLSAVTEPLAVPAALLPPLTPKDAIEQVLLASRVVDTASERTSLLTLALTAMDRDAVSLPSAWLETTRADARVRLEAERIVDRAYQSLASETMAIATTRAKAADVIGLERLAGSVRQKDETLGAKRPETVAAILSALQSQLDAARRLQLARDRWALRAADFRKYHAAIDIALKRFVALKPALERIKSVAGSSQASLTALERGVAQILKQAGRITPPAELVPAHAMLVSAVQLAGNAARIRVEATMAGDIARAWDASSAAAGALMLGARARTDIQDLLRPPQLR